MKYCVIIMLFEDEAAANAWVDENPPRGSHSTTSVKYFMLWGTQP